MRSLLSLSRAIDSLNDHLGRLAALAVMATCLVSAAVALLRYGFDLGSNAWLEIQWYLFAAAVMLGASHTLRKNEHVRVDIFFGALTPRGQLWLDLVGTVVALLPAMAIVGWMAWPVFVDAFAGGEMSQNDGGLIRWPFKLLLPLGFALLCLQGVAEIIKRALALHGDVPLQSIDLHYERPLQ